MKATDHNESLDELYIGYVEACGELRIAPLSPDDLFALLQVLTERDSTTLH